MPTHVLITGAARGIGRELLSRYLSRPDTVAIATVRGEPNKAYEALSQVPTAPGSKLVVAQYEAANEADAKALVETLKKAGITKLDLVIANAGVAQEYALATTTSIPAMYEHFKVNTVGPLVLFQALHPLLETAAAPKFVAISSISACMTDQLPFPLTAYGASKAALNFVICKIHAENPTLTAFSMNPGGVYTDMGATAAEKMGVPKSMTISVQESADGLTKEIDSATRETHSGSFVDYNGQRLNW